MRETREDVRGEGDTRGGTRPKGRDWGESNAPSASTPTPSPSVVDLDGELVTIELEVTGGDIQVAR